MKRLLIMLLIILTVFLAACSREDSSNTNVLTALSKEGIAPYKLSEKEKDLLYALGIDSNTPILSFNAPKEAITLDIKVNQLNENGEWEFISGGSSSIGTERIPVDRITGTLSIYFKDDHSIDFIVSFAGRASFSTDPVEKDEGILMTMKNSLKEFREIELNKEIPVGIMVGTKGNSMSTYSVEDYFQPERFEGMDLVQIVTLTFTDEPF